MNLKTSLILSATLNTDTFSSLIYALDIPLDTEGEYVDNSKKHKGMIVAYHAEQYKKRISILFDLSILLPHSSTLESLPRKIRKRLRKYFRDQLAQLKFSLSSAFIAVNLNLGNRGTVEDYLTVLRRIGRVKGYTLKSDCAIGGTPSFLHWIGNSNSTALRLCSLEDGNGTAQGILRAEVQLLKNKAVCKYIKATEPEEQMIELADNAERIFLRVFATIVPYGVFLKQPDAVRLIQTTVLNARLRQKMWRLISLIPDKKSLLGGQKAVGCRDIRGLMDAFVDIDLSPVTIAKRHQCSQLPNLYDFLPFDWG